MSEVTDTTTTNTVDLTSTTDQTNGTVTTNVDVVEPTVTKNDLLRELSKEHGVNLFEAEGLKKFKEFQDSQRTDLEKLQAQIEEYKTKENEWTNKQVEYNSKLKASELGIAQDKLADAMKLAEGNPDNLAEVIKKYPTFKSQKDIVIGVTDPNNNSNPSGLSEQELYMAKNPRLYKK